MTEHEFEYKALLTEAEYLRLYAHFSQQYTTCTYTQINHYYDTREFLLSRLHVTLRVREKATGLTLEFKHGQRIVNGMRAATEDRIPVSVIPAEISGKSLPDCDDSLIFYPIGSLTTVRTDYKIGNALLSLDKNTYLGITDFEVEVEVDETGMLPDEITQLGISFSAKTVGKFHRFLSERRKNTETFRF